MSNKQLAWILHYVGLAALLLLAILSARHWWGDLILGASAAALIASRWFEHRVG